MDNQSTGSEPPENRGAAWHCIPAEEVQARLGTGRHGLAAGEARARLQHYGPNTLPEPPRPGPLLVFARQFTSPLIFILLVAAAITLALQEYIDASVIAAVLIINAVIGFTQERRAETSVRALMSLLEPHALVVRDGREVDIPSSELVPGDLVLVESGVRLSADLRIVETNSLHIDESAMTGESFAVEKAARVMDDEKAALGDRINMGYAGTTVVSGRGRGFVVATATYTELGKIAGHMRVQGTIETPLQARMVRLARLIGVAVAVSSVAAFAIGVALGESISEMFIVAVALAVSAVPEGLPIAFTITLAVGVRRMAARNAMIRRLPAVETLGSTTVIGTDKTGTLTENRLSVRELWAGGRAYSIRSGELLDAASTHGGDRAGTLSENRALYHALLGGVLANEAAIHREGSDYEFQGDPTDTALLRAAADAGLQPDQQRDDWDIDVRVPFESERQFSGTLRRREGSKMLFVKGAPERILAMCDSMRTTDGQDPVDAEGVETAAREMANEGLRVIAVAHREVTETDRVDPLKPESMVFLGLLGMMDPPRAGVAEAIAGCRDAGIRVLMITGDHAITAAAIGRELGILDDGERVLSGPELEAMSPDQFAAEVAHTPVFARASPENKLRIVESLRTSGNVVAITGDGVNDAPALRAADIGIAMGKDGTDVAREAADMVLADDNFVSIYAAVEEGRGTFDAVRRVTFFLVSTGAAEIAAILIAVALGWPVPLLAAQLLWLNLVTNGLLHIALVFEPREEGLLKRKPRSKQEGVLNRVLLERTVIAGLVMGIGTLVLFRWELNNSDSIEHARTVALTTLVLFQMLHVGNCRSEWSSVLEKSPFSNPFLLMATAGSLALHVVALYLPPIQYVLRVEPPDFEAWVRMIAVAFSVIVAVELHKLVRRGQLPT